MNNLPLPLPQIKPKSIFRECVDGYRDKSKHRKLLSYEARVEDDSDNYAELIIESSSAPRLPSIPDADRKQLMALYEEKFVGDPGRKYYNQILGQAPYGLCPLCGVSQASTLDHFLPKSKYPTLSVTPANLIPSCRDCNMKKSSNVTLPVHLYYDIIPDDIWLYVSLKQELAPVYSVKCPDNWNARLAQRVKTHFKVYELGKLYSAHAAQEIAGKTPCWKLIIQQNATSLKKIIEYELVGLENLDKNSWKAALYRSLLDNIDKVESTLNANRQQNSS